MIDHYEISYYDENLGIQTEEAKTEAEAWAKYYYRKKLPGCKGVELWAIDEKLNTHIRKAGK